MVIEKLIESKTWHCYRRCHCRCHWRCHCRKCTTYVAFSNIHHRRHNKQISVKIWVSKTLKSRSFLRLCPSSFSSPQTPFLIRRYCLNSQKYLLHQKLMKPCKCISYVYSSLSKVKFFCFCFFKLPNYILSVMILS